MEAPGRRPGEFQGSEFELCLEPTSGALHKASRRTRHRRQKNLQVQGMETWHVLDPVVSLVCLGQGMLVGR